jgi:hypothetical protein
MNYTQPLQQRNTLVAVEMNTTKKEKRKLKKQKSRYNISGLATTIHPSPRQHLKYRLSKNDVSKKKTLFLAIMTNDFETIDIFSID